jgi:integrase
MTSTNTARGNIRERANRLELRAYAGVNPATGRRDYLLERLPLDTPEKELGRRLTALVARADEIAATRRERRKDPARAPRRPAPVRRQDRTAGYVLEDWWDAHAQHLDSAGHVRMVLDTYLLPVLGDVALWRLRGHLDREEAELDPDLVNLSAFEAELLRSGKTIRRRRTTREVHRELRAANKTAGVTEAAAETMERARVLAAASLVTERGPLKPAAVERIHGILHAALAHGVRKGWLASNPASDVKRAKVEERESTTPEEDEANDFLHFVAGRHHELYAFTLLVASGPRPQEVAAVRWLQVDLDAGRLSLTGEGVVQEKDPGQPERWVIRRGETEKRRRRVIALDPVTVEALRELRRRQLETALGVGATIGRRALVFSEEPDGSEPVSPHALTITFGRYVRRARRDGLDVPAGMRLYDFRHFGITQLLRKGRNPADVARRFGTSARVINARYAHAIPGDDERMAETMADVWAPVRRRAELAAGGEPISLEDHRARLNAER